MTKIINIKQHKSKKNIQVQQITNKIHLEGDRLHSQNEHEYCMNCKKEFEEDDKVYPCHTEKHIALLCSEDCIKEFKSLCSLGKSFGLVI